MRFLLFLILVLPLTSFAQLTISPAPVNGNVDLDTASSTFTFVNTTTTPVVMNLALVPKAGFSMPTNRCSGKTLNRNQSCYVIISVNDSLLSTGVNIATINQAGSSFFTVQRTKIQGNGSSIFDQSSLAMPDFSSYNLTIRNLTPTVKSYNPVLTGVDASKYRIVMNRCQNVASAKTCSVTVSLSPQSVGTYSATLSEPQITGTMSLSSIIAGSTSGVVAAPVEGISVDTTSIDFGTLYRFGVTGYRKLVVSNTGNVGFSPSITLNGSMLRSALNRCTGTLAPGKSCSLYVYLDIPSTEGNGAKSGLSISIKSSPTATAQTTNILATLQVSGNVLVSTSPMQLVLDVYSVSVGSYHSCALDSNGIARCWGWGAYGKLGAISSNTQANSIPLYLRMDTTLSGKTIAGIAAAGWQTCELTTDNKLFCQGYNSVVGSLGINSTVGSESNPTEIYMGGVLAGLTVKSASMGYGTGCLIASDDYVYCWGDAFTGGLGNGTSNSANSAIQAIKVNGLIQNIKMKQIAKNGYSTCSLSIDDRTFCWGQNLGMGTVPTEVILPNSEKAKFISLGSALNTYNACAVSQTNKIYCWGQNISGVNQITLAGDLLTKTIDKVVSGPGGSMCLVTSDDYGYCFNAQAPATSPALIDLCKAPYFKQVKSLGLGQVHTCASTTDSQVYCWGQNSFGQLGNGTTTDSGTPVQVNFN